MALAQIKWYMYCIVAAAGCAMLQVVPASSSGDRPGAAAAAAASDGEVVYGVGQEFTVQTDASFVQLAQTSPRENVGVVKQRLGASSCGVHIVSQPRGG